MCSFIQQAANIHRIPSRNKLSKIISTTGLSWDHLHLIFLSKNSLLLRNQASLSQTSSLDSGSVSKLEKKGSAPIFSWPNNTSHRSISSGLYSLSIPFPDLFIWLETSTSAESITPFHFQKGSEKSTGKPVLNRPRVCCSYYMLWSHGSKPS